MNYSEENFNKLYEEYRIIKSDNEILKNTLKGRDKHYMAIINAKNKRIKELEEQLFNKNNKQERLF